MLCYVRVKLIFLHEERVHLWGHNTNDSRVVSNVNKKNWPGVKKKTNKKNGQATRLHLRAEWRLKQLFLALGSENKEGAVGTMGTMEKEAQIANCARKGRRWV